ncbi:MAG TPA: polymer-forming cytoskeletal protein [Syntrophales bacterium]|nr:polymer-forming cytoskeletal protein [Syntrophales bacterium]HOL60235.1 polymer-forming cytoskeletal protein [Syntrophales bacterium]HPO36342.1 polymer-forming cytoskeletal protein [Syntrophales bacterium]
MIFQKKSQKVGIILGETAQIKGDLWGEGMTLIKGKVTGNIEGEQIIIDDKASIYGDIIGQTVSIAGEVDGQITAKEMVEIKATGHVKGDIKAPRIAIEEGAYFYGFCYMEQTSKPDNIVDLTATGKDAAKS